MHEALADAADVADLDSREEKLAELRRRMNALPSKSSAISPVKPGEVFPVEPDLARLLPGGGLPKGSVIALSGAASLAVSLVASVSAAGARVALCGIPGFGMAAALERGANLDRIALIHGPLAEPVAVASVLLDGADVVLCGLGGAVVPPSRGRAVAARVRSHGGVLLLSGGRWDGVTLHIDARVQGYRGLGAAPGRGRIRGIDLAFTARGRGCRNPYRGTVAS